MGRNHRRHRRGICGRLHRDHRIPQIRVHLFLQGLRHLSYRLAIIVAILLLCGVLSPLEGIPVSGNA